MSNGGLGVSRGLIEVSFTRGLVSFFILSQSDLFYLLIVSVEGYGCI